MNAGLRMGQWQPDLRSDWRLGSAWLYPSITKLGFASATTTTTGAAVQLLLCQSRGIVPDEPQGNPELWPEHTVAYEAGLTWQPSHWWAYDFSVYYRRMTDLVARVATADSARSAYANVGATAAGLEVTLETYDWNPWYARVNYSLSAAQGNVSHVDDKFDSTQSLRTPLDHDRRHTLNVDLGFHPRDNIQPGVLAGFRADILASYGTGLPYTPLDANGTPTAAKNSLAPARLLQRGCYISQNASQSGVPSSACCVTFRTCSIPARQLESIHLPTHKFASARTEVPTKPRGCDYRLGDRQYRPAQDENHDGYVTLRESHRYAAVAVGEFDVAQLYYAPGRRVQLGISFELLESRGILPLLGGLAGDVTRVETSKAGARFPRGPCR